MHVFHIFITIILLSTNLAADDKQDYINKVKSNTKILVYSNYSLEEKKFQNIKVIKGKPNFDKEEKNFVETSLQGFCSLFSMKRDSIFMISYTWNKSGMNNIQMTIGKEDKLIYKTNAKGENLYFNIKDMADSTN